MLRIIAGVVAILIIGVLAVAFSRPDSFRVQRTAIIKAPPEKVYALVADLRGWNAWSPYETKDPAMRRTLSGAPSGKGAVYEWSGNHEVGKGRMEITDTTPPSKVLIKLDFLEPFEAHNTAEFSMLGKGDSTDVTWAIYGPSPFLTKLISVFLDMDRMIGSDFEAGLANLKAIAER